MTIWLIVLILIVLIALAIIYRGEIMQLFITLPKTGGRYRRPRKPMPKSKDKSKDKSKVKLKDLTKYTRTKSEAAAIQQLEELIGQRFPTAYPDWLTWKGRHLELDGYNSDMKLALEFSGPLHTKWTPTFEPYTDYYKRITRDVVKLRLATKHGINLIVIDMSLPRKHWRDYLASRLADFGLYPRPANYIAAQIAPVFRNPSLEAELKLTDMAEAEKL